MAALRRRSLPRTYLGKVTYFRCFHGNFLEQPNLAEAPRRRGVEFGESAQEGGSNLAPQPPARPPSSRVPLAPCPAALAPLRRPALARPARPPGAPPWAAGGRVVSGQSLTTADSSAPGCGHSPAAGLTQRPGVVPEIRSGLRAPGRRGSTSRSAHAATRRHGPLPRRHPRRRARGRWSALRDWSPGLRLGKKLPSPALPPAASAALGLLQRRGHRLLGSGWTLAPASVTGQLARLPALASSGPCLCLRPWGYCVNRRAGRCLEPLSVWAPSRPVGSP